MTLDTWSATKNGSTDRIDTALKVMITKDQKIVFSEDYYKLKEGNHVAKHLNYTIYHHSWKME